jgi:serine/threonine-protein kinase HipA
MKLRCGQVKLAGKPVGTITENADGTTSFQYSKEWMENAKSIPVSLTMPIRIEPYVSNGLHPFFENLLPEGWLLEVSTKALKISKDDAFGLLLATCGDCIGAVEIDRLQDRASSQ